jgi:phospholipase/lecithinase/hemolysin
VFHPRQTCILLLLAAGGVVINLQAGSIDAIDAFGDSLSDVGNVFLATSGAEPASPYFNGQFSNGNVWVQGLATGLGLAPLTPSLAGGTDYAVGDAQTGTTLYNTGGVADLLTGQLPAFELANPGGADPNALYTIWIGANDLNAIPGTATPGNVATDIGEIVGNIDTAINTLASLGAKNFLVVTVPDLGKTPDAIMAGDTTAASALSAAFDNTLVNGSSPVPSLSTLAAGDSINISVLNTFALIDAIVLDPGAYDFMNVTQPCLTGEVNFAGGTPCANPNQFLFWDGDHPTAAGQALVADAALAVITPEPASISLIAAGLLGLVAFRRFR